MKIPLRGIIRKYVHKVWIKLFETNFQADTSHRAEETDFSSNWFLHRTLTVSQWIGFSTSRAELQYWYTVHDAAGKYRSSRWNPFYEYFLITIVKINIKKVTASLYFTPYNACIFYWSEYVSLL